VRNNDDAPKKQGAANPLHQLSNGRFDLAFDQRHKVGRHMRRVGPFYVRTQQAAPAQQAGSPFFAAQRLRPSASRPRIHVTSEHTTTAHSPPLLFLWQDFSALSVNARPFNLHQRCSHRSAAKNVGHKAGVVCGACSGDLTSLTPYNALIQPHS